MHSARHILQEIGKGRQEGVDARVELGCWAHSTAAKDRSPASRADGMRMRLVGALPDRYALESRVNRVCNIMHRQWRSVQTWLQKTHNGDVEPSHDLGAGTTYPSSTAPPKRHDGSTTYPWKSTHHAEHHAEVEIAAPSGAVKSDV
jgi:hypothetical protein